MGPGRHLNPRSMPPSLRPVAYLRQTPLIVFTLPPPSNVLVSARRLGTPAPATAALRRWSSTNSASTTAFT